MLPEFPEFAKLTVEHKDEIKRLTAQFEPYSDFNFTSLLCWNTDGTTEVARLDGNLVVKMPDYLTGETVYSIIGNQHTRQAVEILLGQTSELKLIPEVVINSLGAGDDFQIQESTGDFDYVLDVHDLAHLSGGAYKKKRNKLHAVMTELSGSLTVERFTRLDDTTKQRLREVFEKWQAASQKGEAPQLEKQAFENMLRFADHLDLCTTLISYQGKPVAFSVNEILPGGFAICHFEKALPIHPNVNTLIVHEAAKHLLDLGCERVNWEQDLDIAGLKQAKSSFNPTSYLKKYYITAAK